MGATLTRLYPSHAEAVPLRGLYLAHRLRELATGVRPFIYADFVVSLDGRIAVRDEATGRSTMPRGLTSRNDLRLLLELHAQADCIVTHAGYLRAVAAGEHGDVLQVGTVSGHEDLLAWRAANGFSAQPAVCIVSASLDFPFLESLQRHGQRVFVATGTAADPARVRAIEAAGHEVVIAGTQAGVEGAPLARELARHGLRTAFLLAGPRMLETTLRDGVLSRLYLTTTHRIIGGERFHSLLEGRAMGSAGELKLRELHLDRAEEHEADQMFAWFDPLHRGPD